jgi:hypothetical protein
VFVDRYTGWPGVPMDATGFGITKFLVKLCEDYGVPVSCTIKDYGIHHRISSVTNPHTNARAEFGIKTVKRMLRVNVLARGTLDRAVVSRALLQLRSTPDRDTKLSSAKALSLWERAQRLLAKAGVCPDGGHVDNPGR